MVPFGKCKEWMIVIRNIDIDGVFFIELQQHFARQFSNGIKKVAKNCERIDIVRGSALMKKIPIHIRHCIQVSMIR